MESVVVDGYHYTNHHSDDYLCRKWRNPAPQDGSAPNLVYIAQDKNACEQLNSWLGGFESIMKHMTPSNFNWFIHSMIFYHTQQVIKWQNSQNFKALEDVVEEASEIIGVGNMVEDVSENVVQM
ncbi:hypothetical protein BDQ17DRAFT_1392710 [Cyathus striatus]|nr:hypothetical protein BDQ17DRAFT_1392710 [Cyathus striatus]